MDIYIYVLFFAVIISQLLCKRNKLVALVVSFIPIILMVGTRVNWGQDYAAYELKYNLMSGWNFNQYILDASGGKFEIGFFTLINLSPSYNFLVFLCSALYIIPVFFLFYLLVPPKYCSLSILFWMFTPDFFGSFVAMRSSVMVGLLITAFLLKFYNYKKIAIIVSICSFFFHNSGILFTPIFFVDNDFVFRHREKSQLFVLGFCMIALFVPMFFSNLANVILEETETLGGYVSYTNANTKGLGFLIFSIFRIIFIFYVFDLIKKGYIEDRYLWLALFVIVYYCCCLIQGIEMMYRICGYSLPMLAVFMGYVLHVDGSMRSKTYVFLSLAYAVLTMYWFTQLPFYIPYFYTYESFLSGM